MAIDPGPGAFPSAPVGPVPQPAVPGRVLPAGRPARQTRPTRLARGPRAHKLQGHVPPFEGARVLPRSHGFVTVLFITATI